MDSLNTLVADQEEWNEGLSELEMEYEKLQEQVLRVRRLATRLQLYKEDRELECYLDQLENARVALL
jgi:hypothetical protein